MDLKLQDIASLEDFKKVDTSSWETVCDSIFVRILNYKFLEYYNPDIAYKKIMDLVYTVAVQEYNKDGFMSHMLTNKELNEYEVSFEDALEKAIYNSEHDRNRRIMRMRDSLLMKHNSLSPICRSIPAEMPIMIGNQNQPGIVHDIGEDDKENILVVINSKGPLGSSYTFLSSTLDEVYYRFNKKNFYILPMSINEVMFVSDDYATDNGRKRREHVEDDLLDMIEVTNNSKDNNWKDVLSYKVYYYMADDGKMIFPIKR